MAERKGRKTPLERFVTVAPRRTNHVLDAVRLLERCADRRIYEFEEPEVDKIFEAIDLAVARARARFDEETKKQPRFQL